MMTSPDPAHAGPSVASPRARPHLTVDVSLDAEVDNQHDIKTPPGVRGHADLRSPGAKKTPLNADLVAASAGAGAGSDDPALPVVASALPNGADGVETEAFGVTSPTNANAGEAPTAPIPDFITQTDRHGNATTPRNGPPEAARRTSGPQPKYHVDVSALVDEKTGAHAEADRAASAAGANGENRGEKGKEGAVTNAGDDACDTLLDSFRMMCCCLLPEEGQAPAPGGQIRDAPSTQNNNANGTAPPTPDESTPDHPVGYSTRGHDAPLLLEEHSALHNGNDPDRIKLLPPVHPDDRGKKCLVLDLDETLVHSSFRAVPGADFVIPVQIEDVVHFVYVAKRPGVDKFLIEMARHYEIVVYTASLNKYADVLLDLLDPRRVIRTRLFRESCVFYEGNYVKDLSLLNRDLSQCVIIDNSPASYLFHPENAIDCTSFIDDASDRELDHIGKFLAGVKDVADLRGTVNLWRHWPNVDLSKNQKRIR